VYCADMVVDVVRVGIEIVEEAGDDDVCGELAIELALEPDPEAGNAVLLLLLLLFFPARAPPTPPPTAAAMITTIATAATTMNVRLLSPHIAPAAAGSCVPASFSSWAYASY